VKKTHGNIRPDKKAPFNELFIVPFSTTLFITVALAGAGVFSRRLAAT